MKKKIALLLTAALLLSGCASASAEVTDLMEEVPARVVCLAEEPKGDAAAADFAVRLFQHSLSQEGNTLVSPLSVLSALGMTANGAKEQTLAQMEQVLGMDTEELNTFLYSILDGQSDTLKLANSIWFTDDHGFAVSEDFLETNANYYHADLYQTKLDETAKDAINSWVSEKTDGMIPSIIDKVPDNAIMYLVNALSFDAEWASPYEDYQVEEGTFTKEDGTEQSVELMHSTQYSYVEDEYATGFMKAYQGGKYAFIALLPKEGGSVEDYVATLTGAHIREMLENTENTTVYAALPKFEAGFEIELSDTLQAMGITDAFSKENADFTGLGTATDGNIFISQVKHKTQISVTEMGTKAGAATAVEMICGTALIQDYKTVTLDRPFVYMIVDTETWLPIFMGTLMDVDES